MIEAIKLVGIKIYIQMCIVNKRLLTYSEVWNILAGN
jgi:hypothetical protein